jgi:putative hydrolase of HD superfamily
MAMSNNQTFDSVFHDFLTLKKIRRTGWQLRGIRDCESLADHCYGVVLLTHLLAPMFENIDRNKAVSMAIIHEIGECRVGDIPYTALAYFPEKSELETRAVKDILAPLEERISAENVALFEEFESGATIEAKFVRAVDKLEMLITAAEYEKNGFSGLTDFWNNDSTFRSLEEFPLLAEYARHLKELRSMRVAGKL